MVDNDPSDPRLSLAATDPDLAASIDAALTFPILGGDHVIELMARAASLAVQHIDGADHAGMSVEFGSHPPLTLAPTDDRVDVVDQAQYDAGTGPCLTAARTDTLVQVDLPQMGRRWPDVSITAYQCGIDRVLAAPLHRRRDAIGSLNLYTDAATPVTISPTSAVLALLLAHLDRGFAEYSDHLERAEPVHLVHRTLNERSIHQIAQGIISELRGCSRDDAADALTEAASIENTSVQTVAERVVATRQL